MCCTGRGYICVCVYYLCVYYYREKKINQRGEWNENLEVSSWKRRMRAEGDVIKTEMRMAAKAAMAVRITSHFICFTFIATQVNNICYCMGSLTRHS